MKRIYQWLLSSKLGQRKYLYLSFGVGISLLVLSIFILFKLQKDLRVRIHQEVEIADNIGKILLYDEILTMSARMAASSHDSIYEKRYRIYNDKLDQTIKKTLSLFASPEAKNAVQLTDEANLNLVKMELHSFELNKLGKYGESLSLLNSEDYLKNKKIYQDGMETAFAHLRQDAQQSSRSVLTGIRISQAGIFLSTLLLAILILFLEKAQQNHKKEQIQMEALRVTMATVMDIVFNTLNGLSLFRMHAESGKPLNETQLQTFDDIISKCQNDLQAIGNMTKFSKKEQGFGLETLDYQVEKKES